MGRVPGINAASTLSQLVCPPFSYPSHEALCGLAFLLPLQMLLGNKAGLEDWFALQGLSPHLYPAAAPIPS